MRPFPLILALLIAASPARAEPVTAGTLVIEQATASATIGRSTTAAAYVTIRNAGSEPDRLLGASSPLAERTSLHVSLVEGGGTMRMRPVSQVDIPVGETVAMTQGGALHLMLEGLKQPLRVGGSTPLTLRFEHAGDVQVRAEIVGPGGHRN